MVPLAFWVGYCTISNYTFILVMKYFKIVIPRRHVLFGYFLSVHPLLVGEETLANLNHARTQFASKFSELI